MIVIADTGGLLPAFDRAQPDHKGARRALDAAALTVVSAVHLAEVHYMASRIAGRRQADGIVRVLARLADDGRVVLADTTPQLLRDALAVRARYAALDLDFADAGAVVLAAEYGTNCVLTTDRRDFRAVTPLSPRKAFRLLPDNM